MKKAIDYRFKFLYVIGMILVVAGHCEGGGIDLFYDWFTPYSFHLALFMFASGYFYKKANEDNPLLYIKKKFMHLIVPFYLWNLIYGLIITLMHARGFTFGESLSLQSLLYYPIISGQEFKLNLSAWFIIPLFLIQVYFVLSRKIFKNVNEHVYFCLNQVLGIIGLFFAMEGYQSGLWLPLMRCAYFLPFFSCGFYYHEHLEHKIEKVRSTYYFGVIFALQFVIFAIYHKQPSYMPAWCNDFYEGPILPFIVGYIGIAFWLRVAKYAAPLMERTRWMMVIADNTFSIMMHQFLGFFLIKGMYALVHQLGIACATFDMNLYHTDFWYYYPSDGMSQMMILYFISGMIVPLIIAWLVKKVKLDRYLL